MPTESNESDGNKRILLLKKIYINSYKLNKKECRKNIKRRNAICLTDDDLKIILKRENAICLDVTINDN